MGFLEMNISQRMWDIAKVIESHVGYETPIQWRIAAELEQREIMLLKNQPVPEDKEARKQQADALRSLSEIALGIDGLPRWMPVSRTKMVVMYNNAIGASTPETAKWWRYKSIEDVILSIVITALILFTISIVVAYVKF